jgi:hypothetical protein
MSPESGSNSGAIVPRLAAIGVELEGGAASVASTGGRC